MALGRSKSAVKLAAPGWKQPRHAFEREGWWVRDVHPRSVTRFETIEYDALFRGARVQVATNPSGGVQISTTDPQVARAVGIPQTNKYEFVLSADQWPSDLVANIVRRTRTEFTPSERAKPRNPAATEEQYHEAVRTRRFLDAFTAHYGLGGTRGMLQSDIEALLENGPAENYLDAVTRLSLAVVLDVRDEQFALAESAAQPYLPDASLSTMLASRRESQIDTDSNGDPLAAQFARIAGGDQRALRKYLDGGSGWAFEVLALASLSVKLLDSVFGHPRVPLGLENPYLKDRISLDPAPVCSPPLPHRGERRRIVGAFRDYPAEFFATLHGHLGVVWSEVPPSMQKYPRTEPFDYVITVDDPQATWEIVST